MADVRYSIKSNRLSKAIYAEGVNVENDAIKTEPAIHNCVYLYPIDAGMNDASWGRFHFDMSCDCEMVCEVLVACSNFLVEFDEGSYTKTKNTFKRLDAKVFVNTSDILLYDMEGRYLYVAFVFEGEGEALIENIKIDRRGDNFMQIFPEVYQDWGGFFHRYMSVFSSVYNDLDEEIANLPKLLDLDTCDVSLLPIYGKWMGLDVGNGFLEEDILRNLVKEAYVLNRMKGTKWCIERITEIILGQKAMIVERNATPDNLTPEQVEAIEKLYGRSIFDVTLLLTTSLKTNQLFQLEYILEQFIPIRCQLHVIELGKTGTLDLYTYLDINARSHKSEGGVIDESSSMDTAITLL